MAMTWELEDKGSYLQMSAHVTTILEFGRTPTASNAQNIATLKDRLQSLPSSADFYGMGAKEIINLNGWADGLELAKRYQTQLPTLTLPSLKRQRVWGTDGDEFDRDRFDANIDECWSSRGRRTTTASPIVRLTCMIGGNCSVQAADLAWAGAAAIAICDAAEDAGYRLEIEAIQSSHAIFTSEEDSVSRIKIKDADEPLDRDTTVMALACPAFFRWHVLRSYLNASPRKVVRGSFGRSNDNCPEEVRGDIHLGLCRSDHDAKMEVHRALLALQERFIPSAA